ncbi:MAG: 4-hydroxythreonine-4-phosphate dehydrogenase PdxA [Deltaproteobacteria bacterium]|nr:4-hydroxythreonine-4-phosphate dehydrogenase PdxA [Deltaproteobacteria bacterium]
MGDPVGIGPEIVLKALANESIYEACLPLVLGDEAVLGATSRRIGTGLEICTVNVPEAGVFKPGRVDVVGLSSLNKSQLEYGRPTKETARAMVDYIMQGIDWAMEGRIHGLVTCPINKAAMQMAGVTFDGHTELLAHRTKASDYVMMLAGSKLRVALVTIHVPLAQVPGSLTVDGILRTIRLTEQALRTDFGIPEPKVAVAGLNPHGGEQGLFGDEEMRVIQPAIEKARKDGVNVSGPFPPDTVFHFSVKGRWDAVVCMYHDQGLIPFKLVHFSDGVNVTLGLPIVRTSVAHGTAYDIAGTNQADPGSLVSAVEMAAQHAMRRAGSKFSG